MPCYVYGCRVCDNEFEVEQSISAKPEAECPRCRIYTRNRLIAGGSSFVLKGDGWAKDLYSSKGKP